MDRSRICTRMYTFSLCGLTRLLCMNEQYMCIISKVPQTYLRSYKKGDSKRFSWPEMRLLQNSYFQIPFHQLPVSVCMSTSAHLDLHGIRYQHDLDIHSQGHHRHLKEFDKNSSCKNKEILKTEDAQSLCINYIVHHNDLLIIGLHPSRKPYAPFVT